MIRIIQNSSRLCMLAIIVILMAVGAGCKSKKKAAEASDAAAEKAKLEQELALRKQKEEEEARKREAEEKAKRDAEYSSRDSYSKLNQYFNAIATSGNTTAANNSINEALALFASGDTPVLIVIHESADGQKDYDRPTTIRDYLNYLKDQKKSMNKVHNLQFDSSGKITEVELIKQK